MTLPLRLPSWPTSPLAPRSRRAMSTGRGLGVTGQDIQAAKRLGFEIKLLAVIESGPDGSLGVRVHPAMVPADHRLPGAGLVQRRFCGGGRRRPADAAGRGAGGLPTASAVLGDLVDAAHNLTVRGPASAWSSTQWLSPDRRPALRLLPEPVRGRPPGRTGLDRRRSAATMCRSARWNRTSLRRTRGRAPTRLAVGGEEGRRRTSCSSRTLPSSGTCKRLPRGAQPGRRPADRRAAPGGRPLSARPWRGVIEEYREHLPVTSSTPVVSLLEGGTPLIQGVGCPKRSAPRSGSKLRAPTRPVGSRTVA